MTFSLNHIISEIQRKENEISLSAPNEIDEAYKMMIYLKNLLTLNIIVGDLYVC